MRQAGRIAAGARSVARQMIAPGVTTKAINKEVFNFIRKSGAEPTFLGYNGYPASACISVNDQVIHGIPGSRRLREGDIVSNPPKQPGVCDFCGGELTIRKDDAPETVKARLATYHQETEPLKDFYAKRDKLKMVENQPTIEETTDVIVAALGL